MKRHRIVLYNPRAVFHTMPLGLLAVGSALDRTEFRVVIVDARLESAIRTMSVRDAAAMIAAACGVPRRTVYARALELAAARRGADDG